MVHELHLQKVILSKPFSNGFDSALASSDEIGGQVGIVEYIEWQINQRALKGFLR